MYKCESRVFNRTINLASDTTVRAPRHPGDLGSVGMQQHTSIIRCLALQVYRQVCRELDLFICSKFEGMKYIMNNIYNRNLVRFTDQLTVSFSIILGKQFMFCARWHIVA